MKKMKIQYLSRRISPTALLIMSACYSASLFQAEREMSKTPDLSCIPFFPLKLLSIILIQLTSCNQSRLEGMKCFTQEVFLYPLFSLRVLFSRYLETEVALIMEFTVKLISSCAGLRIQVVFHSTFLPKSYGFLCLNFNIHTSVLSFLSENHKGF